MSKPVKLPSGAWRIRWLDSYGTRKSETYKTLDAAKAGLRRRETEIDDIRAGRKDPGSDQTFGELADAFLRERDRGDDPRRDANRETAYKSHLDHHLKPLLGSMRLLEITEPVIERLPRQLGERQTARPGEKNTKGRTLSAASIRNILTTFRLVMAHGRRKVSINLPKHLRQTKRAARKRPKCIASAVDVGRYLDACKPEWFRVACALAIYCGHRRGEIASLRWDALDLDEGTIAVVSSWGGKPKNDSERTTPLAPELAVILKRWRLATGGASSTLVVRIPRGDKMEPMHEGIDLAKRVRRVCKKLGIDGVNFHGLRATFGTHAADAGMPVSQLRAIMGHADISTTAIYLRSDSAIASVDERARLSFARTDAPVVSIGASEATG